MWRTCRPCDFRGAFAFLDTRRTRRLPATEFGPVSERSAESKTAMRNPLIGIEISPEKFDISREVRTEVWNRRAGI